MLSLEMAIASSAIKRGAVPRISKNQVLLSLTRPCVGTEEIVRPILLRIVPWDCWIRSLAKMSSVATKSRSWVIGQRRQARSHSGMSNVFSKIPFILGFVFSVGVLTAKTEAQTPPSMPTGTSPPPADSFAPQTPVQTFVDPNSGQWYGRYILYETVPVAKYEYKPVVERQYVPEWHQETKQTTQVQYVPIVTYQLQPVNTPSWNPFSTPQPSWQYAPVVQYQPRYTQVNQPITYQKYVEKEVTKYVPELVVKSERAAQFVDRPLTPNGQALPPTTVTQQPPPIRPLDQIANNTFSPIQPAPSPYYANQGNATVDNFGAPTGYNASMASNPQGWYYGTRWGTASYAANPSYVPQSQFINNPYPNAGLASYPQPAPMVAARPSFQWPGLMTRTGSLFSGGVFNNRQGYSAPNPTLPYSSQGTFIASNPMPPISNGGYTSSMPTMSPWLDNGTNSNGISFRPRTPTLGAPQNSWNLAPVDNYRDPTQVGIPSSVIR
jgi:hypothetical protein